MFSFKSWFVQTGLVLVDNHRFFHYFPSYDLECVPSPCVVLWERTATSGSTQTIKMDSFIILALTHSHEIVRGIAASVGETNIKILDDMQRGEASCGDSRDEIQIQLRCTVLHNTTRGQGVRTKDGMGAKSICVLRELAFLKIYKILRTSAFQL